MLFRLGRDLGIADIDALADTMGTRLLDEWIGFYLLEDELREEARLEAQTSARLTAGR
jgi:hypothetical protein